MVPLATVSRPWVLLLTDCRELGQPILMATAEATATPHERKAIRFETEADAKGWAEKNMRFRFPWVITPDRMPLD